MDTSVSDDLYTAIRQQYVDENPAVMFGIPDAQLAEKINGAVTRRLFSPQRNAVKRAFDDEAQLPHMGGFAGPYGLLNRTQSRCRKCALHLP